MIDNSLIWPIQSPPVFQMGIIQNVQIKSFQNPDIIKTEFKITNVGHLRALEVKEGSVWVGGTQGKIAKSLNNGESWTVYSPSQDQELDFRAICAIDSNIICAMSCGESNKKLARIYRTSDGGEHWSLVFCPEERNVFFNSMKFWDEKNGILLCDPIEDYFVLFMTSDGGLNWNQLIYDNMPFSFNGEQAFAASNSCLAVYGASHVWFCTGSGSHARVFYSSDRGRNWDVSIIPMSVTTDSSGLFSISFKDESIGIAVGGDYQCTSNFSSSNVFLTMDGGKNWYPAALENRDLEGHYLSSVGWSSNGKAYVIDGAKDNYNSLLIIGSKGWAVGSNQQCAMFEL